MVYLYAHGSKRVNLQIDVLVNNAGRSQRSEAIHTQGEVDRFLMDLNFMSTIALTKAVLTTMVTQGSGNVVVVSSVAGKKGEPLLCLLN